MNEASARRRGGRGAAAFEAELKGQGCAMSGPGSPALGRTAGSSGSTGGSSAARASSRPWRPRPPPGPTGPGATAPRAARSVRRGRGTPHACSCTSTTMKGAACRQTGAGRPPGPAPARCPRGHGGGRAAENLAQARTGADERRHRAVRNHLQARGEGRSTLGIMQATVFVAAGGETAAPRRK